MRKRVFVALNLEKGALDSIEKIVNELLPKFAGAGHNIRFVSRENWHLTVSFLGYQEENDIPRIVDAMRRTAKNFGEQEIVFRKVLYGPPSKMLRPPSFFGDKLRRPSMIWLLTDSDVSRKLTELKAALEDNLEEEGIDFKRETRPFAGHLTLARLNFSEKNFGGLARFERSGGVRTLPTIDNDTTIKSTAQTLDLMESELKRGGAEYTILQKIQFKHINN